VSGGSGSFVKERLTSGDTGATGELPDLRALSALKLNGTPVVHFINKDGAQLLTQAKVYQFSRFIVQFSFSLAKFL
jgi:hypothetical protein